MIINSVLVAPASEGDYTVRFIDYDGTILKEQKLSSGQSATAPAVPVHAGLTFQEWNNAFTNVTRNVDVGANYITTDGKTKATVRLTVVSGLSLALYMNKSNADEMSVDWGDGSAVETFTNSGNFNTGAHTFPDYGDYEVNVWMSGGTGTYGLGNGTAETVFVGDNVQNLRDTLLHLRVGERVNAIGVSMCQANQSLTTITLPSGLTGAIGASAFNGCVSLVSLVFPSGMTGDIKIDAFRGCHSLVSLVLPSGLTGDIKNDTFRGCFSLVSLVVPSGMTGEIAANAFPNCHSLTNITLPSGMTGAIGASAFVNCRKLFSIVFPSGLTGAIGASAFNGCVSLVSLVVPSGMTGAIGDSAFNGCLSILEYVILPTTPQTLSNTNAFLLINAACKIYVPDASTLAYRAATNWVTYANYIHPISNRTGDAVILFQSNGGTPVAPLVGTKGDVPTKPTDPTKSGSTFDGWHKDAGLTTAWNWATDVYPSTNLTLYAKWV
jgi:uncharacterized repeat protein (TIGR02543 family)